MSIETAKIVQIMMNSRDKALFDQKGITPEQVNNQLHRFDVGFPFLKISQAASNKQGVLKLTDADIKMYQEAWDTYISQQHKIVKFVPASGAASRMFKDLFSFIDADYTSPQNDFEKHFFKELKNFAFYKELDDICSLKLKQTIDELLEEGKFKEIVMMLLHREGLNYGQLPKGLLTFHQYEKSTRTAFEEHLVEGALYAKQADNKVAIHFTVSSEHKNLFKELLGRVLPIYEKMFKVEYDISFSEQKECTDTIAVDMSNQPFRIDGEILFRPGGHGALIENLNDLQQEIIFIKNIDNVVPDHLKTETVTFKKVLAGVLVHLQAKMFAYLEKLNSGQYTHDEVLDILQFVQKELCCKNPETKYLEDSELALYLIEKLNRPIRVCGMVKNVGEPGGGPFLVFNSDGTISPQILESSQIDMKNSEYLEMFQTGTHFNPVDLVCGIYDYKGEKFNLLEFVDSETGFISHKSKNGKALKALELPGLWNGAMSDWNTVFVEVTLATFNPVKTVNDLLRVEHQ